MEAAAQPAPAPAVADNTGVRVLVTGGTGFIASHVIQSFARAGFSVFATMRNVSDEAKRTFLQRDLGCAGLFQCDLTCADGWAEAVAGMTYVIHTASPFKLNAKDGERELVKPALDGNRHVLEACLKEPSIKRVVITVAWLLRARDLCAPFTLVAQSSVAAVCDDFNHETRGPFNESHWNETSTIKDSPYPLSKTRAERFAWEFMGLHKSECAFDLVTVNPVGVFGPVLLPPTSAADVNTSNQLILAILNKDYPGYPHFEVTGVDVRDCAHMHLLAATHPNAKGRYICASFAAPMVEVARILIDAFPALAPLIPPPTRTIPNFVAIAASLFSPVVSFRAAWNSIGSTAPVFDASKGVKDLGMTYRPKPDCFVDCAKSLAQFDGVLKHPEIRAAAPDSGLPRQ